MPTSIDRLLLIGLFISMSISLSICQLTYAEPPVDLSSQRQKNAITFAIELQEGGRLTNKAVSLFESYMARQSCSVIVIEQPHQQPHNKQQPDLLFSVQPTRINSGNEADDHLYPNYEPFLMARTINDEPLTITLMTKSSANINDITSLQGERFAVLSQDAFLGGKLAIELLAKSGVDPSSNTLYQTGNYLGSISLLLHGDVFFAAIPGPLARLWKDSNKLSIIAESSNFQLGLLLIKKGMKKELRKNCQQALLKLKPSHKRDKKMAIFPAWFAGFK